MQNQKTRGHKLEKLEIREDSQGFPGDFLAGFRSGEDRWKGINLGSDEQARNECASGNQKEMEMRKPL